LLRNASALNIVYVLLKDSRFGLPVVGGENSIQQPWISGSWRRELHPNEYIHSLLSKFKAVIFIQLIIAK
jgi:hypothetical protein